MARKKRNIFQDIWHWLLDMGLLNAALLINLIVVVAVGLTMAFLKWILNRQ